MGINLLVSAFFGTRLFLPGRAWPIVKRTLKLGPTELEHEYPPRFAQALGGTFLALAGVAFLRGCRSRSAGCSSAPSPRSRRCSPRPGSASAAACTSCAGSCPSLFAKLFRRTDGLAPLEVPAINRIG